MIIREAIPVTAVGKIFKPELRFDAAKRVLEATLRDVGDGARRSKCPSAPTRGTARSRR